MTRKLLSLSIVFLIIGLCLPIFAFSDFEAGLTHGTNKHRPEFGFDPQSTYHLYSAQNEWEPFQVLIRSDAALTDVNVTVSEFVGPGDPITGVELYRVHYVPVYADQISHHPPDPTHAGYWPDGLVPFVDHFVGEDRDGAPFDVEAGFSQGVFVDVFIPETQTPGDYTATVTVSASGESNWTGTVTLTVWNFVLPNGLSLVSNYQYSRNDTCGYHTTHGNTTDCDVLHERYFEEYARHRMSPYRWKTGNPPYTWEDATQTLTVDWTGWDAEHGPYLDGTFYRDGYEFMSVTLPRNFSNPPAGLTQEQWDHLHWSDWADHFKQNGWIEKLWNYLPDEPDPDQYGSLADTAARIHAADPDLQPFVTEQYEEGLGPDIDIWCPDEPLFSDSMPWPPYPEKYEELRADGKKTWWYNCVSATLGFDYANHMVDQESTYMRIWLWLTRRYEFTGILFWRISYLWSKQDVWENMYSDRYLCQGDGTLYYPGIPSRIGGSTDIPIPSIRIKVLREAMEDYEYFILLDQSGSDEWVDDLVRSVAPKSFQWEHDWEKLLYWRKIVAEKIMGTLDEDAPDPPNNLSGTAMNQAVELSWTAPQDADLDGFDIWYALYEGDAFFGGTVDTSTTTALVEGLTAETEHMFWVRAFDTNQNRSEDSDIVRVTPFGNASEEKGPNDVTVEGAISDNRKPGANDNEDHEQGTKGCGGWF